MDFLIDKTTGDLDVTGGLKTVSGGKQRQQQLKIGMTINQGEWFLDINEGIPYINTGEEGLSDAIAWLLSDTIPNKEEYIKDTLDQYIKDKEWVTSLISSSFLMNRASREYTYYYTVETEEGDEFTDTITSSET